MPIKLIKYFIKNLLAIPSIHALICKFYFLFKLDNYEKSIIRHNKKIWTACKKNKNSVIILDVFDVPETVVAYSYMANILAQKHNSKIVAYLFENTIYHPKIANIYNSFNVELLIRIKTTSTQKEKIKKIIPHEISKIKTKSDLIEYKFNGIDIGIDIYESILRDLNLPTVDLQSEVFKTRFQIGLEILLFWDDFFQNNDVKSIIISHDNYIWMNGLAKTAYKYKTPVYLPNVRGLFKASKSFDIYEYYQHYSKLFNTLNEQEKVSAIAWSKSQLEKKFSGAIGVDMPYSTETGFKSNKSQERLVFESDKLKILIASHCFFDNPHAFNKILFPDFYEWLNFLGEISLITDYDWYIKVHPDPLPNTIEIVKSIIKKYPNIKLLPINSSHFQIIEEGISVVLSVYGTVGEEYPALGIPAINAGYNPRINYSFNIHPKSIDEYKNILLNLKEHLENFKINKDEIYQLYYMHRMYAYADDLFFNSYAQYLNELSSQERSSSKVYHYFLEQHSNLRHDKIIDSINSFLSTNAKYYFSKGPISI